MNCEQAMQRVLMLDNGQQIPPALEKHLAACPACRLEARLLGVVVSSLSAGTRSASSDAISERVMQAIMAEPRWLEEDVDNSASQQFPHRLFAWVVAGVVIFSSMFLVQYSDSFRWLRDSMGVMLQVWLSVALALMLVFFIGAFVASHLSKPTYASRPR